MYKVKRFSKLLGSATVGSMLGAFGGSIAGNAYGSLKNTDKEYKEEVSRIKLAVDKSKKKLDELSKLNRLGKLKSEYDDNFDWETYKGPTLEDYESAKSDYDEHKKQLEDLEKNPDKFRSVVRDRNKSKYQYKGMMTGAAVGGLAGILTSKKFSQVSKAIQDKRKRNAAYRVPATATGIVGGLAAINGMVNKSKTSNKIANTLGPATIGLLAANSVHNRIADKRNKKK